MTTRDRQGQHIPSAKLHGFGAHRRVLAARIHPSMLAASIFSFALPALAQSTLPNAPPSDAAPSYSSNPQNKPVLDQARPSDIRQRRWAPDSWPRLSGDAAVAAPPAASLPATADQRPPQSRAGDLLQRAEQDRLAGRTDAAIEKLEQLIGAYPQSREAGAAKDLLVAQFRITRQTQAATRGEPAPAPASKPASPSPAIAAAQTAAAAAHTGATAAPAHPASASALRRGGDDFKQSVGDRIFFEAGSARIETRQRGVILAQAAWLVERSETKVKLDGHADDPGPRELNAALARERADAVRVLLVKGGVPPERIEVVNLANTKPVALCGATAVGLEPCAAQNRRVVSHVEWTDASMRRKLSNNGGQHSLAAAQAVGGSGTPTSVPPQTGRGAIGPPSAPLRSAPTGAPSSSTNPTDRAWQR